MHYSALNVEEDSFEDELVHRSYFGCTVESSDTSSVAPLELHASRRNLRKCQHPSYTSAADHLQVTALIHRTEQLNGIVPLKENSVGKLSATDDVKSTSPDTNNGYRYESDVYEVDQFQRSNVSASVIIRSQQDNSEEVVSSSTLNSRANSVRFRSASFCTSVTLANEISMFSAKHSVDANIPRCSILESILLNRNIPKFYTTRRWVDNSERAALTSEIYKRPRLHSLRLPTLIPTNTFRKARSTQDDPRRLHLSSSGRDVDSEKPLCLTFKKRKFSLENDYTPENDIASGREGKRTPSDSDHAESSKPMQISTSRKDVPSGGSILHTLLSNKCSGIEQPKQGQRNYSGEFFNCSAACLENGIRSDTCLPDRVPVSTISHVDSTESLQTLEMLALADKTSRHCVNRPMSFGQQRVVIAKRMQPVANRKVKKWLAEIAQFAAKYRDLTNLPRDDWIILLRNALSRLLLLFMAESNFQFAVAPISAELLNSGEGDVSATVVTAEVPTAQSVEDIQRFIAKCQAMKVNSKEYHCMRLITLFHSGCGRGLQLNALVEQISSCACKVLQGLARISHPDDKLRYGELLLHLHSLASVNSRMVQRLFCLTRDGRGGHHIQIDDSEWLM